MNESGVFNANPGASFTYLGNDNSVLDGIVGAVRTSDLVGYTTRDDVVSAALTNGVVLADTRTAVVGESTVLPFSPGESFVFFYVRDSDGVSNITGLDNSSLVVFSNSDLNFGIDSSGVTDYFGNSSVEKEPDVFGFEDLLPTDPSGTDMDMNDVQFNLDSVVPIG